MIEESAEVIHLIHPLSQGYGFLVEYDRLDVFNTLNFISLIQLDLHDKCIRKLHTIEYHSHDFCIVSDTSQPTHFVLSLFDEDVNPNRFQIYKVENDNIVIGELIEFDHQCHCYYDESLYSLHLDRNHEDEFVSIFLTLFNITQFKITHITVYNVKQRSTDNFDLVKPDGYNFYDVNLVFLPSVII
jgi:hypothetical protein